MPKKNSVFIFVPVLFLVAFSSHKFYVSLVEISYNRADSAFEITMKIFTDDLENAVQNQYGMNLKLGTKRENKKADSLIYGYLQNKFGIETDGTAFPLVFVGKEVEMDITWIYLEMDNISAVHKLIIKDHMITEIYDDQVNLINVNYLGKKHSLLLHKNKISGSIEF